MVSCKHNGTIMTKPRVLLADDHQLMLEGLRKLLEDECEVVGAVEDGKALVAAARKLRPDLVLLDVSMPLLNGLEAARHIKANNPEVKIIFLTMQMNRDYVREAFAVGASGYVSKLETSFDLISAIRQVQAGKCALSPYLSQQLLGHQNELQENPAPLFRVLTPRQREVLQLVSEGKSAKQIANLLCISEKTVEFHKKCLMQELQVQNSAQLARYAVEQGWVHS